MSLSFQYRKLNVYDACDIELIDNDSNNDIRYIYFTAGTDSRQTSLRSHFIPLCWDKHISLVSMSGRSIADMVVRRQGGGIEPDFSHVSLESHGYMIIGIASAFTGFAATMVLARLYVRTFMLKTMGSDDWVIIIAMVRPFARHIPNEYWGMCKTRIMRLTRRIVMLHCCPSLHHRRSS